MDVNHISVYTEFTASNWVVFANFRPYVCDYDKYSALFNTYIYVKDKNKLKLKLTYSNKLIMENFKRMYYR
ncbi:hypothetical protein CWI36_0021p0010 [Hamiltosporidium magnivora]|uniref:Uncharacterized protein n=1 Tax=Hamiltosporidium magnivora TaxID=148818 RepID=A0A4Q9LPS3_9MICR|nr:hypothetical protein CWI36_0021p0010 [Hamiltosporidium magnivora]